MASSAALRRLVADERFVGTDRLGFLGAIHTWGRQMEYHPHVPYVVPGGGLCAEGSRWLSLRAEFLVPVTALSILFRAKSGEAFRREGLLALVIPAVWCRDWWSTRGPSATVARRCGISRRESSAWRSRTIGVISCEAGRMTFTYPRMGSNRPRRMTVDADEFLRRFLQHVLSRGFKRSATSASRA